MEPFVGFPGGSDVKSLPAMPETQIQSLGWVMAICSSILIWRIPRAAEPGRLRPMGSDRGRHDWVTDNMHRQILGRILNWS